MRVDTNWYWYQHPQQNAITVPTRKILHPQLEVNAVTDFHDIPKMVCNRTHTKKSISINPIGLTDSDYNYILKEIYRQGKNYFERYVKILSDNEEN